MPASPGAAPYGFLRRLCLNLGFYSLLFGLTVSFILAAPVFYWRLRAAGEDPAVAVRRLIHRYGVYWSRILRLFYNLRVDPLPVLPAGPYVIVANHRSFFDTYCFAFLPEENMVFAVRAWPFRIPFYGPFMYKAGYLNTEKEDRDSLLQKGKDRLAQGAVLVFFPEGTRSATDTLGRFHAGAFALAAEAGVPVLPYCLHGTGDMLPRGAFFLRPANIRARVLSPMSAPQGPDGPDARALRKTVKAAMARALDEMKHD